MGKTEKGAVWLDEEKTSVFDFFQFWRNLPDGEVMKCLKLLTFFSIEEINALPFSTVADMNAAKKKLAHAMTEIVHGQLAANATLEMAEALFESRSSAAMETIEIEDGVHILDLLMKVGFAKSRTDARNLINGRGIVINDQILDNPTLLVTRSEFGDDLVVKKGKKNFRRFIFKDDHEKT
jgi:tyrosyl-tRNA synthetase